MRDVTPGEWMQLAAQVRSACELSRRLHDEHHQDRSESFERQLVEEHHQLSLGLQPDQPPIEP
jgi:hypothetical protein